MSIKITPHDVRADITVDSINDIEEAMAFIDRMRTIEWEKDRDRLLQLAGDPADVTVPSSSGLATESTAAADTGVVEGGPVEEPKRECRTWTPLEEEHLQVWYRDGCSVRQIADRLGRSWSSVNNKRLHLARGRDRLNLDPMREDEK